MFFLDVNIVVHAIRASDGGASGIVRAWLDGRLDGPEPIGLSEFVLAGMTRIVTQPRLFAAPSSAEQCVEFADALVAAPATQVVRPGPRHWGIFSGYVTDQRLRGNDVADAYLASLAVEQGATFVTLDRGFARFGNLRTLDPLAAG